MNNQTEEVVHYDTNIAISSVADFKKVLVANYKQQLEAQLSDPSAAKEFMSNAIAIIQANPKLLECTPHTVFNGLMMMASLKLMPSNVSGEAYLIPYKNKGVLEAQFQLGYQGLITLFYRSGAQDITADIVYTKDKFTFINNVITHEPDVFADNRGEAKGAYVIVTLHGGGKVCKVMSAKDILAMGKKFSKSYGGSYSPWDVKNDPELWMWKKTVLKQVAKLVPKNAHIVRAIAEDNKDSIISDRLAGAKEASKSLSMGNLETHGNEEKTKESEAKNEAPESNKEQGQE